MLSHLLIAVAALLLIFRPQLPSSTSYQARAPPSFAFWTTPTRVYIRKQPRGILA